MIYASVTEWKKQRGDMLSDMRCVALPVIKSENNQYDEWQDFNSGNSYAPHYPHGISPENDTSYEYIKYLCHFWQCTNCFWWFDHNLILHHTSYDPEHTVFVCTKCHASIHKTGIPSGRKEYIRKIKEQKEKKQILDVIGEVV